MKWKTPTCMADGFRDVLEKLLGSSSGQVRSIMTHKMPLEAPQMEEG